jgi:hypothetical protein
MMIGFVDDTEMYVPSNERNLNVYLLGGYFLDLEDLESLQQQLVEIKLAHGLRAHHPVKWNLRDDRMKKFYYDNGDEHSYSNLLQNADSLRKSMLRVINQLNATIITCGVCRYSGEIRASECYQWAFENMLQRFGLLVTSRKSRSLRMLNELVADWPRGDVGKGMCATYASAYYEGMTLMSGQPYYSGPLCTRHFADSLRHCSMLHSSSLQLADLVTGCMKDFLYWCYTSEKYGRIQSFMPLLVNGLRRSRNGMIDGYGICMSGGQRLNFDSKISEFLLQTRLLEVA